MFNFNISFIRTYTIYINISQSMMYYDGVKKTFFLPHIFKESDGRVNLPSLFFCADSDENVQEEVTAGKC